MNCCRRSISSLDTIVVMPHIDHRRHIVLNVKSGSIVGELGFGGVLLWPEASWWSNGLDGVYFIHVKAYRGGKRESKMCVGYR